MPTKPLKLKLKLLEKTAKKETDVMSFKFSRNDEYNHLDYKAGQYAIVDLGTNEDPKGPTRSMGEFVLPDDNSKSIVFLSGEIGVTPFRSMVKYVTDNQVPSKITMFD